MDDIVIRQTSIKESFMFSILFLFLIVLGVWSQWPTTITPDAAMHAEIVELIGQQGYVTTWQPYADNAYTYPPLFHYLAFLLPLESIDAVRALGIVLWLVLPVVMYLLVSTFNKKAGMIAAFLVVLVPSFSNVFIYSEFPQLLAMILLLLEWYLLRTERVSWAACTVGVIGLTHVFFVLIAALLFLVHTKVRDWKYGMLALLVMVPWLPAYVRVVMNVLFGQWENVRYNATQPVFGFWGTKELYDWFVGVHGLTAVLVILSVYGFFVTKDRILRGIFVFSVFFTVFHVPFTQLKILDLLAFPVVMLASLAITSLPLKTFWKKSVVVIVVVFMLIVQVNHFYVAKKWWLNPEIAPTEEFADAARWLGEYDDSVVRVYFHQASAWGGILAHKLPLEPDITHLEAFSESYRKQIDGQREIKDALADRKEIDIAIVKKYDVKYLVVPVELESQLDLLYENGVWGVYTNLQ